MKIGGKHYRSVWPIGEDAFGIIDQAKLPHAFETMTLRSADDAAAVINSMQTRGAPLIGVVGVYGLALEMRRDPSDENLMRVHDMLAETRPTAINLRWALARMRDALLNQPRDSRAAIAWKEAGAIADEDVAMNQAIGRNGLKIIRELAVKKKGEKLNRTVHTGYDKESGEAIKAVPIATMVNHGTNQLFIDNLILPREALIGEEGKGFSYVLSSLNAERILVGSESVGDGRWFVEYAVKYSNERRVFNRPIGMNQGVQFPIAKAHVAVQAADLMRLKAAALFDAGLPCGPEANMTKYLASEAAWESHSALESRSTGHGIPSCRG